MRYIQKGKEPDSLTQYKKHRNAYFDGYAQKDDVRDCLLKEQGYLCGYCMRRLHDSKETKIEHMVPQSVLKENEREALNYKIMLGVCYGNEKKGRSQKALTCDASRGNRDIALTPFEFTCIDKIAYKTDGTIYSTDSKINADIQDILNLNYDGADAYLKQNRRETLAACKRKLMEIQKTGNWNKSLLEKVLKAYEEPDEEGKRKPYSGIAVWYLKKRLENAVKC